MKLKIIIDKDRDEEILVYAKKRTKLVDAVEQLVSENAFELIGYIDREAVRLSLPEVSCFVAEDNKIFALSGKDKLYLRCRLYQLEENLPENFIKINQSCIANIKNIERFDSSISGTLTVKFKNGYIDCVSRRNIRKIKERLGI